MQMKVAHNALAFTVYDADLLAHKIESRELYLDRVGPGTMQLYAWHEYGPGVPHLPAPDLLVYYEFSIPDWASKHEKEGSAFFDRIRIASCLLVQCAALGWQVTEKASLEGADYEYEVAIHRLLGKREMQEFSELCPNQKQLREMCKTDLLAFYIQRYDEEGPLSYHDQNSFLESGRWRVPYSKEFVKSVHGELLLEKFLGGHMTAQAIKPDEKERAVEFTTTHLRTAHMHLQSVGEKEGWMMDTRGRAIQGGRRIFIGHGASNAWRDLKDLITERLGLEYEEFNRESPAGYATKERLNQMLDSACFAFLVMTGEDDHGDGRVHARENVVHEAGLFQGRFGFERAIILLEDGCEPFSNIEGLTQIRFPKDNLRAKSEEIRKVLEREGVLPR